MIQKNREISNKDCTLCIKLKNRKYYILNKYS